MGYLDICKCTCDTCTQFKKGLPLAHCHQKPCGCKVRTPDERLVDRVLERDRGLSTWEEEFVESCSRQLEQGGALSERQREILLGLDTEPS